MIDFDPQMNASEILRKTFDNPVEPEISFWEGLKKADLTKSITKFTDNISMLEASWELVELPNMLEAYRKDERKYLLRELLKPIKGNYDYILIDTPPTLSDFTNNAIFASDWVIAVMQTQEQAYSSTLKFISYLQDLSKYESSFDLLGVVRYLIKKNGTVDNTILKDSKKTLGKAIFDNDIYQRERVKGFGRKGITKPENYDIWDKKALYMYQMLLDEILSKAGELND